MRGATLGDIVGSRFEWHPIKTKDFEFINNTKCFYTDDSVMTIAVAEVLLQTAPEITEEAFKANLISNMHKWGAMHPDCGFGGHFYRWIMNGETEPYNSWGNGSAMRVSPVGWFFRDLDRTREVARWTAEVTHNHPEGIKGAEATASVIYLARTGSTKEEIKKYIEDEFGYNLNRSLDEIRPNYEFDESCMGTVPEAIICFLEGTDYEDILRNAISLGGDADTLAAIAGSMAEACYGIPQLIREGCLELLEPDMVDVIWKFEELVRTL